MKPLNINFVPRPKWHAALRYALLLLFVLVAGERAWHTWLQHQDAGRQRAESARLESARAAAQAAEAAKASSPAPQDEEQLALARLASFPLARVLSEVEAASVPGVRATMLDISAEERVVTLEIEAGDVAAVLEYVKVLNGEHRHWQLVQAQAGNAPGTAARAVIRSNWP